MKLRTLEEIQSEEELNRHMPPHRRKSPSYDLRPGLGSRAVIAGGSGILGLFRFLRTLTKLGLVAAFYLGILGCIVFGLVYLFG